MQGMHIIEVANSTLLQIIMVWCRGGIALIGAMVKGGDKLVTSYFLLSFFIRADCDCIADL